MSFPVNGKLDQNDGFCIFIHTSQMLISIGIMCGGRGGGD